MSYTEELRTALRCFRPHFAAGYEKVRMGRPNDGGYVCLDDFAGYDVALSLGVNDDASWDLDAVDRGMTVYQFDHTVDAPLDHQQIVFERKMVVPFPQEGGVTLEELIKQHDKGRARPNIILKMDIENWEWPVLDATSDEALSRIGQIVGEFHNFEAMSDPEWRGRVSRVSKKLGDLFAVIHVHANNNAATHNHDNVFVPNVFELTMVNRELYELKISNETFPGPLDQPCNSDFPDIWLGAFRF